jgi:integrase
MKAGREHRVPLSARAVEILREREQNRLSEFVFPGVKAGRPLSVMAFEMVRRRMKVDVTVHGFRSAFRDWAGERTSFPREVAEAALAYLVGDTVERAYRRGDALEKRRRLMDAWAGFLGLGSSNNVVLLSAGADRAKR